ncbi:hypothetical protein ZWY2020_047974 [Hordeum vulgare]|nr:hypothetical protein ZWY2020_047974 [Hordeum vulgare]
MEALLVREPLLLDHEGASVGVAQDDGHERRQDLDEVDDPGNRLLFPSDLGKLSQYLGFSSRGKHGTEIVKTRHHHPWHDSFQDGGCPKSTQQQGSSTNKCHGQDQCWGLQSRRRPRKNQVQEGRNRASPARLVKLNKSLDRTQRDLIENEYFMGGILKIEATTMPADLSRWVLQRDEVGSSKNNLNKAKRQRDVGDQGTTVEEADNDGGILEDDEEYLPSSESGEDEEVASTDDSSDAFVTPIPTVPKQNKLTQRPTHDCPSFNLNRSFHEDESTKRVVSASLKPCNLDVSLTETGDDWGLDLDPEMLQEVCYKAEMEFAKRKENERSEMQERTAKQSRYSDQDVKTPAQTTRAATVTHSTQTTRSKGKLTDNTKPILNYDEFFISHNELANSMAPEKKMDSLVAQIAIISLRGREIRPKKRIMPL